jgi:hypothetical protein
MDWTTLLIIWGFSLTLAVMIGLKFDDVGSMIALTVLLGPIGVVVGYFVVRRRVTPSSPA